MRTRLVLVALPFLLSGCYLTHVTAGQLSILWGSEPIVDVLARGDLEPDQRTKLELVLDVRRYAMQHIGLAESGSYEDYYDTGHQPIVWNVSACARDAFLPYGWWFPFVGLVPYKGFFSEQRAEEQVGELREQDLDVLLLPVPAYSTLGYFDDPVFSAMLDYDQATLAEILIHELAHATVFIASDADFNETLATFVGVQGAQDYFRSRGGDQDPRLQALADSEHDERLLADSLETLRLELWRIYEASGPREQKLSLKAEAVRRFRARFAREVRPQLKDPTSFDYVDDPQVELNNAFLLQYARYHGDLGLFQELYRQCGENLCRTVQVLQELAGEDDPRAALEARVAAGRSASASAPPASAPPAPPAPGEPGDGEGASR